ncbi:MAG: GNAT family N-acetyltransferase, partial [Sulfurovum sp.]
IPYESYNMALPTAEKVKLLRKHFYRIAKRRKELFKTENPISMAETPSEIKKELKNGTLLGETLDGKSIVLYESVQENCVIKEIGRLREISFRFVGEGSGKKRDIDEFDFYYKHLIIWDDEQLEIAGAYRLGLSGQIVEDFDIDGLYSSSLFKYHEGFEPQLASGIELGRSFVQPKYWNSRALDYLWQGLGAFVKSRPDIRYLFGAVSMSDSFNEKAKALMIYFYSHYFASEENLVTHKNPYYLSSEMKAYCESIFSGDDYRADQRVLKEELGYMGYMIPTLYKQYAEVCDEGGVKFLDFGYDKDFNNCIDGFIVVDLHQMKESKKKRYIG